MSSPWRTFSSSLTVSRSQAYRGRASKLRFVKKGNLEDSEAPQPSCHHERLTGMPRQSKGESLNTRVHSVALQNVTIKSASGTQTSTSMSHDRMWWIASRAFTRSCRETGGWRPPTVAMSAFPQYSLSRTDMLGFSDRTYWPRSVQILGSLGQGCFRAVGEGRHGCHGGAWQSLGIEGLEDLGVWVRVGVLGWIQEGVGQNHVHHPAPKKNNRAQYILVRLDQTR
jgi:hypothetical protein